MTSSEFISTVNTLRLQNKGKWYTFTDVVEGKPVRVKGFGTWLQIYSVANVSYSNGMEAKVSEFKKDLISPFK